MVIVNIYEAKRHLPKLVERVAAGEEVVIAKAGRPVGKLVAYSELGTPRAPGGWEGKVRIHGDFDELPPESACAPAPPDARARWPAHNRSRLRRPAPRLGFGGEQD